MARYILTTLCLLVFASASQAQRGIGSGPHPYNTPKANYHVEPIGTKRNAPRMYEPVMTARPVSLGVHATGSTLLMQGLPSDLASIQVLDETGHACQIRLSGSSADISSLRPGWYQVRATSRSGQDYVANFHKI